MRFFHVIVTHRSRPTARASSIACALAILVVAAGWGKAAAPELPALSLASSEPTAEPTVRTTAHLPDLPAASPIAKRRATAQPLAIVDRNVVADAQFHELAKLAKDDKCDAKRSPPKPAPQTANELVDRYVAVGKALIAHKDVDDLWQRFRLVQLNAALREPARRRDAIDQLARIAAELDQR